MELVQLERADSGLARRARLPQQLRRSASVSRRRAPSVDAALDAGVTFFDTAETYGSGGGSETLARRDPRGPTRSGRARDEVRLWDRNSVTALLPPSGRRSTARSSGSCTDYVDLYYLHKPIPATPIAETLGALDELVREGKVRAIGCSNFSAEQLGRGRPRRVSSARRASRCSRTTTTCSGATTTRTVALPRRARASRTSRTSRSPSGLLTGKYRRGEPAPRGNATRRGATCEEERSDRVEA